MKNLRKLFALIAIVSFAATSCSNTDEEAIDPGQDVFEEIGYLDCNLGESCQDVYEMNFKVGTQVTLKVKGITGSSVINIAIYGPNTPLGGTNILTENASEASCWGQDEDVSIPNILIEEEGVHKIAITRDWGASAGFDGYYSLSIVGSKSFTEVSQTIEDKESLATDTSCPA